MSDLVECRDCERQVAYEGDRCWDCLREYVEFRKEADLCEPFSNVIALSIATKISPPANNHLPRK